MLYYEIYYEMEILGRLNSFIADHGQTIYKDW